MIIDGPFLETRSDATALFEPSDALFNHGATTISIAIEHGSGVASGGLVFLVRNDRLDSLRSQPVPHPLDTVRIVSRQFSGFVPPLASPPSLTDSGGDGLPDDRLGACRFVYLTGGYFVDAE